MPKPVQLSTKEDIPPPEPPYVTGGPPYPQYPSDVGRSGLSILDWFAGHVVTGLAMRGNTGLDELKLTAAKDAYYIAAQLVQVRNGITIEPTPAPVIPQEPTEVIPPPDILPPPDAYTTIVVAGQQFPHPENDPANAPKA